MIRKIQAKTVLSKVKGNDNWFGLTYNMNLYRGCQHACIYCDSRSTCYQLGDLSDIRYKENAIEILTKELRSKKVRGTIGFGSMNDPYMPVERKMGLTRNALKVVSYYKFPVHIITKSNLVIRDIDLLKEISKIYAAISFTITTADDELAKKIEPAAPSPSERFEAIRELNKKGIYAGITLMPVLPYINDTEQHIQLLMDKAIESGAKYIIPFFGLTLREGSREYFYEQLDKSFKGIKEKYINTYGLSYGCNSPNADALYKLLFGTMEKYRIPKKMKFYVPDKPSQLTLFG
jgi:DNA repair photolyase